MKKIDLGQTVTILANIGVIAGIIFLAVELRQNNELLESQTPFNHTRLRMDVGGPLYQYPHLTEIVVKKSDGRALTAVEERMLVDVYGNIYSAWEWEFREYERGRLEELPINAYRRSLTADLPGGGKLNPGLLEYWEFRKGAHSDDFVRWFEANIINEL